MYKRVRKRFVIQLTAIIVAITAISIATYYFLQIITPNAGTNMDEYMAALLLVGVVILATYFKIVEPFIQYWKPRLQNSKR